MTPREPRPASRWLWPLVADLVCVVALAAGGKRSHEPADSSWVLLAIVWPFALAAGLAHAWLAWRGRDARRAWPEGAVVLAVTYLLGMLLRALSGRGLAPGFLVVAGLFLAVTMLGWRVVARLSGPALVGRSRAGKRHAQSAQRSVAGEERRDTC